MTQDEITELAIKCGWDNPATNMMPLYEFAKLVADKEREACANLLETTDLSGLKDFPSMQKLVAEMLLAYVKTIRARGQA
jgi:hypothetical protein